MATCPDWPLLQQTCLLTAEAFLALEKGGSSSSRSRLRSRPTAQAPRASVTPACGSQTVRSPLSCQCVYAFCSAPLFFRGLFCFVKILFIYSRETHREAETQAEGDAGSLQEARCGTRSWDSGITPWAEGGAKPLSLNTLQRIHCKCT